MASSIVKSIRISIPLWARIEAQAKASGCSPNALIAHVLEVGTAPQDHPRAFAGKVAPVNSVGKIAFGPVKPKPGARLKGKS
jgi:hypothetical protein